MRPNRVANYLLDTNVFILTLRGVSNALDFLDAINQEKERLYISVVTRTEILAGMRPHEEHRTMELLDTVTSLPADEAIADQAGRLIYLDARQGIHLSFPDALIAATALQHNFTLVTTNIKHFPMPDLKLQQLK